MIESITNKIFETYIYLRYLKKASEHKEFYSYLREKQKEKILSLSFLLLFVYMVFSILSLYWAIVISLYFILVFVFLVVLIMGLYIKSFPENNFFLYKTDHYTIKGINSFASLFAPFKSTPNLIQLEFKPNNFSYSDKDSKWTYAVINKFMKFCEMNHFLFTALTIDLKSLDFTFDIYTSYDAIGFEVNVEKFLLKEKISNIKTSQSIDRNWETYAMQMSELMKIVSR